MAKNLYEFSKRPETNEGNKHEYNPWNSPIDYHGYNIRDAK